MPKFVMLPRLKVCALPGDRLTTNHREGALAPVNDEWWDDVLLDPRARTPLDVSYDEDSRYAYLRLDRQGGEYLQFACACGRQRGVKIADLMGLGGSSNVHWIARRVIDCGNRDKVNNYCRAYCVR
jgi:hypothetical protein